MAGPYKRRKSSSFIRNVWVYRWLIVSAFVLGTLLWFMVVNGQQVPVYLPFGLGHPTASIGLIILGSSTAGAVLGGLLTFLVMTLRRYPRSTVKMRRRHKICRMSDRQRITRPRRPRDFPTPRGRRGRLGT